MHLNIVAEWYIYADRDLSCAEHLLTMHPKPLEVISFHCQQAAEKYLKGFLIFKGIEEPPKIHNLDKLCSMCTEHDNRFAEIIKECSSLTQYSVQPRYPDELEVTENDMNKALINARKIRDFEPLNDLRQLIENDAHLREVE
jgi:HEPN domain-containing protein